MIHYNAWRLSKSKLKTNDSTKFSKNKERPNSRKYEELLKNIPHKDFFGPFSAGILEISTTLLLLNVKGFQIF